MQSFECEKPPSNIMLKFVLVLLTACIIYLCVAMFVTKLPPFPCKAFPETYTAEPKAQNSKCRVLKIDAKDGAMTTAENLPEIVYCCEKDCESYGGYVGLGKSGNSTDNKPVGHSCVNLSLPDYSRPMEPRRYVDVDVCTSDCTALPTSSREVASRWNYGSMMYSMMGIANQIENLQP